MNQTFLVVVLVLLSNIVYGQSERNIWYFGEQVGLDFNEEPPKLLFDGKHKARGACATICDSTGNLLFYTNGNSVWGADHELFPNSDYQADHDYWGSSPVLIPKPNSSSTYLMFVLRISKTHPFLELLYSEIDMSLRNGLGDVNQVKNVVLANNIRSTISVVHHENSKDYWVIANDSAGLFVSFLVNESGVSNSPVKSDINGTIKLEHSFQLYVKFKVNPEGSKIAYTLRYNLHNDLYLADFNKASGLFSNRQHLREETDPYSYGMEFSLDSRFLYTIDDRHAFIHQFDLQAKSLAEIVNSRTEVGRSLDGHGSLELAPDGKIYHTRFSVNYIAVIEYPGKKGKACGYNPEGLFFPEGWVGYQLPTSPAGVNFDNCKLHVPTSFTPNNDGLNEFFKPMSTCRSATVELTVFSKWGEQLYHEVLDHRGWDGSYKNKPLPGGVYYYLVSYHFGDQKWKYDKGIITLIR